jgi:hypothetical protein
MRRRKYQDDSPLSRAAERISKGSSVDYRFWRPVEAGLASSIREVKHVWTLEELFDAHELLDIKADVEIYAERESNKKGR